ncbi:MAG: hypothetical protein K0R60_772, partial [Microbacterium sp.]|nr:hypothetical protein [Microbacterium sp.]
MSGTFLVRGARIDGADTADILIADGRIAEIGRGVSSSGATEIDA